MAVARKDFVAQRKTVLGDNQADQHLEAIGAVITRLAAFCQRVGRALTLEIGARDIVEQQLIFQVE